MEFIYIYIYIYIYVYIVMEQLFGKFIFKRVIAHFFALG